MTCSKTEVKPVEEVFVPKITWIIDKKFSIALAAGAVLVGFTLLYLGQVRAEYHPHLSRLNIDKTLQTHPVYKVPQPRDGSSFF